MKMIDEAFKEYMNNVYSRMELELRKVKDDVFPEVDDEEFGSLIVMEIIGDDLVCFRFKDDDKLKGLRNLVFLEFELFSVKDYDKKKLKKV